MNNPGELLFVVDEQNNPVEPRTKKEAYTERLPHRIVHVLFKDSAENLILHKRSAATGTWPGWWGSAAGGHVGAGETNEAAAVRETVEETGLSITEERLHHMLSITFTYTGERPLLKFIEVYTVTITEEEKGKLRPGEGEVESLHTVTPEEVEAIKQSDKIMPELLAILNGDTEASAPAP